MPECIGGMTLAEWAALLSRNWEIGDPCVCRPVAMRMAVECPTCLQAILGGLVNYARGVFTL